MAIKKLSAWGAIWLTAALAGPALGATAESSATDSSGGSVDEAKPDQQEPPREWVDPATGHRIVRLSNQPGSQSLYFHQYPFSADGRKMVFTTRGGIWAVDLETREVEQVVEGRVRVLVTGRKTGDVYYVEGGQVKAADLDTHESRVVAKLPEQFRDKPGPEDIERWRRDRERNPDRPRLTEEMIRNMGWGNLAPNADETMIVGVGADPDGEPQPRTPPGDEQAGGRLGPRWASGKPVLLYTIDVATGDVNVIHRSHDWLNHLQCSPTDPGQILFCHEGPWHYVDRTWIIRTDGTGLTQIHPRTINREIGGHEFFGPQGKKVWYDLQTPRSVVFWLASYDIETGARQWYNLQREEWSVHYNISPDGKLFCGDGGGGGSVANQTGNGELFDPPRNGKWMYLFRPEDVTRRSKPPAEGQLIETGVLHSERLADLSNHDYDLEPNGIFTPDGKWVVFRSNMHGPSHVYAVEVARAN